MIEPLVVKRDPVGEAGLLKSVAPERLRAPSNREEILLPLSARERLLVVAVVSAMKALDPGDPLSASAGKVLMSAFEEATGAEWPGVWDVA
jgi:hypothetical protein